MISIDFVAGSHGHFLEYVCNHYLEDLPRNFSPFNSLGASHNTSQKYNNSKIFVANHFSQLGIPKSKKLIRITFDGDDLLLLSSGAFLRAGDVGIENGDLHQDTYNKLLDSKHFSHLIESINSAYTDVLLSKEHPDCPRNVLREFFKFGFKNPDINGFTKELSKLVYNVDIIVFDFAYKNFYNKTLFLNEVKNLANWYGKDCIDSSLDILWEEFHQKQKFRNDKIYCDSIIKNVVNLVASDIPALTILQESYINGTLERIYNIEMPFNQPTYFQNTKEIIDHLCLK